MSSAGTLASSSLRNGASLPGIFPVPIERMVRCFGTGNARIGLGFEGLRRPPCAGSLVRSDVPAPSALAAILAFAITRPDPSALTLTLGPICMAVNDNALPPLENSITTMLGWLMTEGFSFQPCDFSEPR